MQFYIKYKTNQSILDTVTGWLEAIAESKNDLFYNHWLVNKTFVATI